MEKAESIIYSKCKTLHIYNGKEFCNKLLKNYCNINNNKFIHGNPYHPKSQGCSEPFNKQIKKLLEN